MVLKKICYTDLGGLCLDGHILPVQLNTVGLDCPSMQCSGVNNTGCRSYTANEVFVHLCSHGHGVNRRDILFLFKFEGVQYFSEKVKLRLIFPPRHAPAKGYVASCLKYSSTFFP